MKKLTNHERATKAAAARWSGARSNGVRIYIDEDVAEWLSNLTKYERRRFASDAIRSAMKKNENTPLRDGR